MIASCGLPILNCQGQSYDRIKTMSENLTGVQTQLQELETTALFHVCCAHAPNLIIVNVCSKHMLDTVYEVSMHL